MYAKGMPSPSPSSLDYDQDRDALVAALLDADRDETARIEAAWMLALLEIHTVHAGYEDARDIAKHRLDLARAIAVVLREPLLWLGSEVIEVLRLLDMKRELAFGVDAHGLVAVSPTSYDDLVAAGSGKRARRSCPVLGDVVMLDELPRLAAHLGHQAHEAAPWIGLNVKRVFRGVDVDVVHFEHATAPVRTDWNTPPQLLRHVPSVVHPEHTHVVVPAGAALHVQTGFVSREVGDGVHVTRPAVGRVVALTTERVGVLDFATARAFIVDGGARELTHWAIEPRAATFFVRALSAG